MANLVAIAYEDKVVPEIAKFGALSNEQETALQETLDSRGASS